MWRLFCGLVAAFFTVAPAQAQDAGWGDLDQLLLSNLWPNKPAEAAFWLPDSPDPAFALVALGFVYPEPNFEGRSNGIRLGIFVRREGQWEMRHFVQNVFGQMPRDTLFLGERIEVTTSVHAPGDESCCPSESARFSIRRDTGAATRLW